MAVAACAEGQTPAEDISDDIQRRYDALVAAGGGTLQLPAGRLRVSLDIHARTVHLRGAGRDATILTPRDPASPVLHLRYATAQWSAVTIADLTLRGGGTGVGLGYGADDADRFGGTIVRNVKFTGFEKSISRPSGNIGLWLEDCEFEAADYHLWGRSVLGANGAVMHNGVLSARRCHFQEAAKAVLYADSTVAGSGQVVFDQCLFENNPGFVFVFDRFESREGVPGVSVRSCWNEANGTGGTASALTLGGRQRTPVFLFADRLGLIEFHDTPLGPVLLLGDTSLVTRSCALDLFAVEEADASASITHHEARIFGNRVVPGLTQSLTNANQKNTGPRGAIFRLPHRIGIVHPLLDLPHVASACRAPMIADGTRRLGTRTVADAILPSVIGSQQFDLDGNDGVFIATTAVPQAVWIAWTLAYRKITGAPPNLSVNGRMGVSVVAPLDASDWTTIGGIAFVDRPLDQLGFLLQATGRGSVCIGGYQLLCFPTRQAATEMLNDGLFREPAVRSQ